MFGIILAAFCSYYVIVWLLYSGSAAKEENTKMNGTVTPKAEPKSEAPARQKFMFNIADGGKKRLKGASICSIPIHYLPCSSMFYCDHLGWLQFKFVILHVVQLQFKLYDLHCRYFGQNGIN